MIAAKTKRAVIEANDGGIKVLIGIEVSVVNGGFTPDELYMIAKSAARHCSDAIRNEMYTDFGPENTTVKVLK